MPSFSAEQVPDVIAAIVGKYVALRETEERFVETLTRVGLAPFKSAAYANISAAESESVEHA